MDTANWGNESNKATTLVKHAKAVDNRNHPSRKADRAIV